MPVKPVRLEAEISKGDFLGEELEVRRFIPPLVALVVVAGAFAALAATTSTPRMHPQSGPLWRTNAPAQLRPHVAPATPFTHVTTRAPFAARPVPAPAAETARTAPVLKPVAQSTTCAAAVHRSGKSRGKPARCRDD